MNIKVAIRVRPFNQRELDLKTELCVDMSDTQTHILKDGGQGIDRSFTFDHCFWSHDDFRSDSKGYHFPADKASKYSDQEKVYNVLGKEILSNAINGYHCCLFAYGQTGAGKSYSIFGYGENKGIVPKICNQLLDKKTLVQNEKNSFSLAVSMLEIYNEKIQDLLIQVAKRPKGGLKVRENNKLGVFVEDLTKKEVKTYEEIEAVIDIGNKNKTLGATLMNATSSRAHTIITLELIQKEVGLIKTTQKEAIINLVDLAGSEKVGKTEAKGDRLKEACSINKSLTVLGIVIHQLYLKSEGEKVVVSYRDSALTRILQNALGGNSKTTMICAISPARDNIEETISTLRYADQAKRIKQNAKVNESETDKLIRELMEENEKLKAMLADLKANKDKVAVDDISHQIRELENVIQYKTTMFNPNQIKISFHKETSLSGKSKDFSMEKALLTNPHMYNLNEDPLLTKKIVYDFKESPFVQVGRQSEVDFADELRPSDDKKIVLNGVGIIEDHARIVYLDNRLSIIAADIEAAGNTFVNGDSLDNFEKDGGGYVRNLSDLDRIIFGTSSTFLVRLPGKAGAIPENKKVNGREIDWEFCQMEKFKKQEKNERDKFQEVYREKEEELQNMERQLKETFDKEKLLYDQRLHKQKEEYERMIVAMQKSLEEKEAAMNESQQMLETETLDALRQMQNEQKTKELEYQVKLNALHKESQILKQIQIINSSLEKKLINYYNQVKEANYIAQELNRNIELMPFVASLNLISSVNQKTANTDLIINVKVINYEEGWVNYWPLDKFEDRLILMRDALEYFFANNKILYNDQNDPFWDPEEFFLYGQSFCLAKSILYKFEIQHKVGIIGYEGEVGHLIVQLCPMDDAGNEIDEEEAEGEVEDPNDLIAKKLSCHYRFKILTVVFHNMAALKGKNCYFTFEVMTSKDLEEYSTPTFKVTDATLKMNFAQAVKIPKVTPEIIDYYIHKNIQIRLFVDKVEQVPCKGKNPPPIIFRQKVYVDLNNELKGSGSFDNNIAKKIDIKKTNLSRGGNLRKTTLFKDERNPASICSIM